jgi:hypothetical protein
MGLALVQPRNPDSPHNNAEHKASNREGGVVF